MTNKKYMQKLSLLKEKLQTLTDELWRNNKEVRNSYIKQRTWEGVSTKVSNTWNDTIENIANSDAIITILNGFNGLLQVVNKFTEALGSLGTISLGTGLFAGIKNVGKGKCNLSFCFE